MPAIMALLEANLYRTNTNSELAIDFDKIAYVRKSSQDNCSVFLVDGGTLTVEVPLGVVLAASRAF